MVKLAEGAKVEAHRAFGGVPQPTNVWTSLRVVVRDRVCRRCNSGWMSGIQRAAQPALAIMIANQPSRLAESAQTAIAAWLTMTAMVMEWAGREPRNTYYTQEERTALIGATIPAVSTVWLGHRPKASLMVVFGQGISFRLVHVKGPSLLDVPAAVNTLSIGHGVWQLLGYRLPPSRVDPGFFAIAEAERPWADSTIRFGPPDQLVSWPPPAGMDDLALRAFALRWGRPPHPANKLRK